MPFISLADTISKLSPEEDWGPDTSTTTTLDGVPYAPYSKGDKLGRMADWTQEGKEGRERGGRQYGRNYRGMFFCHIFSEVQLTQRQTNKFMVQVPPHFLLYR